MTSAPVVSVVMGVYNDERYLRGAIASVLQQRGVNFELVIVDDGSSDSTPQILAELASEDARVRVFTQNNVGLTRALIRGIDEARGCFIARQDSDDLSMPGRLYAQVEMLNSDSELAFVSSWADIIGPNGELLLTDRRPGNSKAATELLVGGRQGPTHGSVMMRRDAYNRAGGYRSKFYYAQDSDLWLRLAAVGGLNYVQQVLYRYRVSTEAISGRLHAIKLPYAALIDKLHAARQRGEDDSSLLEAAVLSGPPANRESGPKGPTLYFIAKCLFLQRDPRARLYVRACLREDPTNLRAWRLLPLVELAAPFWQSPDV